MAGKDIGVERDVNQVAAISQTGELVQRIKKSVDVEVGAVGIDDGMEVSKRFFGSNRQADVLIKPEIWSGDGADLGIFFEDIDIGLQTVFGQNIILAKKE